MSLASLGGHTTQEPPPPHTHTWQPATHVGVVELEALGNVEVVAKVAQQLHGPGLGLRGGMKHSERQMHACTQGSAVSHQQLHGPGLGLRGRQSQIGRVDGTSWFALHAFSQF